ncbi:MAG: hypothetical protein K8J08_05815 [Thermoanaerobaculia bacterium]|nr:hypothetical protein [Thermoanaerobaculia bacterium]
MSLSLGLLCCPEARATDGASWSEGVVYTVSVSSFPSWKLDVSAEFPHTPEYFTMSDWSSFRFDEGWSALIQDAVAIQGGESSALTPGSENRWHHGGSTGAEPIVVRYSLDLEKAFSVHRELPKTTAPWSDGRSLAIPGFCLFLFSSQQTSFQVNFLLSEGWRVDTGWPHAEDGGFYGESLDSLLKNSIVVGDHRAIEVDVDGLRISAVPLGRHADGIDQLAPIVDAHARRFRSLFEDPDNNNYLMVLLDDPWDTGESYTDSFAMAYSTPIREFNQAAWGHTIAHELFHYWLGARMEAADWAQSQWFSEGTTDYMATRAMVDGGFTTPDELFDVMQKHVSFYELFKQGIVYDKLSLVEAGSQKTTHNAAIYDGGWLVAFCFDVILREKTSNSVTMGTVLRKLWNSHRKSLTSEGYTIEQVVVIAEQLGGSEIREFSDRFVVGNESIPLEEYFRRAGLRLVVDAQMAWVRPMAEVESPVLEIRRGLIGSVD